MHCSEHAKRIYTSLKLQNQLIALPDIFIASTAIAHDLPFYTLNRKHFERIEALKLEI